MGENLLRVKLPEVSSRRSDGATSVLGLQPAGDPGRSDLGAGRPSATRSSSGSSALPGDEGSPACASGSARPRRPPSTAPDPAQACRFEQPRRVGPPSRVLRAALVASSSARSTHWRSTPTNWRWSRSTANHAPGAGADARSWWTTGSRLSPEPAPVGIVRPPFPLPESALRGADGPGKAAAQAARQDPPRERRGICQRETAASRRTTGSSSRRCGTPAVDGRWLRPSATRRSGCCNSTGSVARRMRIATGTADRGAADLGGGGHAAAHLLGGDPGARRTADGCADPAAPGALRP